MKVLLLGVTGNLGRRLLPALLSYSHTVILLIRPSSNSKLPLIFSPDLISQIEAMIEGDATSKSDIKNAILKYGIEGIVDVAGNQDKWGEPRPMEGFTLERIARAVGEAAVEVYRERGGRPLRVWVTAGLGIMQYSGTRYKIQDYMLTSTTIQHETTRSVIEPIPTSSMHWSLLAIALMYPHPLSPNPVLSSSSDPKTKIESKMNILITPLKEKYTESGIIASHTTPPRWKRHWLEWIPGGRYLNVLRAALGDYWCWYEDVALFLAHDLQKSEELEDGEEGEWVGKRVALCEREERRRVVVG